MVRGVIVLHKSVFFSVSPVLLLISFPFQIGVTKPEEQQKVLDAIQQMNLDKVDLKTIDQFRVADTG